MHIEKGTTTIATGLEALTRLLTDIQGHNLNWNEAETRFQIIDRLIVDCLGWPKDCVRLEQPKGRKFSDYELGLPRKAIWEAKREDKVFEFPAAVPSRLVSDLPSILALGGELAEAITQVQDYCVKRGVDIAVACNGQQLVAFLASRSDGVAPLEGRCLVIRSYDDLVQQFPRIWQTLSPSAVSEHRLHRFLTVGDERVLPPKVSSFLVDYPRYRYPSPLQQSLATLSELLIIDLPANPEVERQFYEECYVDSGALPQHALITKQLLAARYASLFSPDEVGSTVEPVRAGPGRPLLTPEVLAEAILQRPIVLIGDVGVGKTSFLKHLRYISAFKEFQDSIYIHIDLASRGAFEIDLRSFVLYEIEVQLRERYDVDVFNHGFVQGVYYGEVERFRKGVYGPLQKTDPGLFSEKYADFLNEKVKDQGRHIKESINHLASARRKQIIIFIDNADQRDSKIQQEAFVIAHNLATDWKASVFIALWPQTFYSSKQASVLTGYSHRIFTIAPPRVDDVIEKRLVFAQKIARGEIVLNRLKNVELKLDNIANFISALLYSLRKNRKLTEFLENITGGNIRAVIEFVAKFVGSANVDARKIIDIVESKQGTYEIPLHEFSKAALLGEYSFYDPNTSMALNLFDVYSTNTSEHFLLPMILGFLNSSGDHRNREGFVSTMAIAQEMQRWGFPLDSIERAVRRANNKKLIETPQRLVFVEDEFGPSGDLPSSFRISTVGAYHLKRWISEFSYLDAVSFDTPILDNEVLRSLQGLANSFEIGDRFRRADSFRQYLSACWHTSGLNPVYFDWNASLLAGEESFRVVKHVSTRPKNPKGRWPRPH